MNTLLPVLFASIIGIAHAFDADHLIAVSNIVSKRDSIVLAMKDGIYWGLGHTTTIVIVGSFIILSRATFLDSGIFEAIVGATLIIMGITRLTNKNSYSRAIASFRYKHGFAYTVGLIHGLAGSGALVLLVMSEIKNAYLSIAYLIIFGIGSMLGMLIAASLFSIPFTLRMKINTVIKSIAIVTSSIICISYGGYMIYENLIQLKS
ncbi:urease accessory protein [Fulvivirga sp. 29W222]|uniref:Urease accessory protein n=1 Tax=Fulvivirga marina TaxID=2494733 RepID=A0A937G2C9_9BACT|nr:urease accessory protein [Fulvivirga marina]MBL6449407.1 urease accessory protein [Fulvivirga marina]